MTLLASHIVGPLLFCWYAAFGFLQTWCCVSSPNISTLVVSDHRTLLQKSCGLFRQNSVKLNCDAVLYLERRHKQATLFFLPFHLAEAGRVWSSSGFFLVVPLSTAQSYCGMDLLARPLLRRLATALNIFQDFRLTLWPFPDWWAATIVLQDHWWRLSCVC